MKRMSLFGGDDEAPEATRRREEVRMPQQQAVLEALMGAYPHPISHADLCERVGTNRASHRIAELIAEGWQIDGLGVLPLDAASQTQLYRLATIEKDTAVYKDAGWTIRLTSEGLRVNLHKDLSGRIPPAQLAAVTGKLYRLLYAELVNGGADPKHVGELLAASHPELLSEEVSER